LAPQSRTRLFAAARWSADALGLGMLEVIVACLLRPDAPPRLVILAAQYLPGSLVEPTTAEILAVQRAWAAAAA
jgi:hypothetical protein